jgi:tetrapyrrole methylase family protein/MazG family protein
MDHSSRLAHLSSLFIPSLKNASSLTALAETVAYLRGPNGCPWDQEQTRHSLRVGFLEESSEVLEAIDNDDSDALREELGDVLYHLVMQAQIASEEGEFQLHDVIADIEKKLKRRHPHVWGDWQVDNTDEVIRNWEMLKKEEKKSGDENSSVLDNIPATLSALAQAQELQERVKEVGFDWPDIAGVIAKVHEEILELHEASTNQTRQQEVGDLIFAIVNWCRWLDVNAETALSSANRRFSQRFRQLEQISRDRGLLLSELDLNDLDKLWQESKDTIDFDSEYDIEERRKERADGRVPPPISGQGGRSA